MLLHQDCLFLFVNWSFNCGNIFLVKDRTFISASKIHK